MIEQAVRKLREEMKSGSFDRYGNAMKTDVCRALEGFCRQDGEFAEAVVQGGSFSDCMKAVAKKVKGGAISDMEAFGEAVRFYFPGAGINVTMEIDLCASVRDKDVGHEPMDEPARKKVALDLSDFF